MGKLYKTNRVFSTIPRRPASRLGDMGGIELPTVVFLGGGRLSERFLFLELRLPGSPLEAAEDWKASRVKLHDGDGQGFTNQHAQL
jgi:hypothetical protein